MHERVPVLDRLGLQAMRSQRFDQGFAPSRRIRRDQHAARIVRQERPQRRRIVVALLRQRQRGRRLIAERVRFVPARMTVRQHLDAADAVEALAQRIGRREQLVGRQHGALDIVPALFVAFAGLLPERRGGVLHAFAQHAERFAAEIVEQRRRLFEEQRQVILDAGRRAAFLQILVERAAARVDREALAQQIAEGARGVLVEWEFARRQHAHRCHFLQRALGLRIEAADRVDLLVQQLDAIRLARAHRIDVEQRAAHGEIARV